MEANLSAGKVWKDRACFSNQEEGGYHNILTWRGEVDTKMREGLSCACLAKLEQDKHSAVQGKSSLCSVFMVSIGKARHIVCTRGREAPRAFFFEVQIEYCMYCTVG